MKKYLITLSIVVFLLSACQSTTNRVDSSPSTTNSAPLTVETTRMVKEKYEQDGQYYVSVDDQKEKLIAIRIPNKTIWDQIEVGKTVSFDSEWQVVKINWKDL